MLLKDTLAILEASFTSSATPFRLQIKSMFYLTLLERLRLDGLIDNTRELNNTSIGSIIARLIDDLPDTSNSPDDNMIKVDNPALTAEVNHTVGEAIRAAQQYSDTDLIPYLLLVKEQLFTPVVVGNSEVVTESIQGHEPDNHSLMTSPITVQSPIMSQATLPSESTPTLYVGDVLYKLSAYYSHLKTNVIALPTMMDGKAMIEDGTLYHCERAMHCCRIYFHLMDELVDTNIISEKDNISRLCFRTHLTTLLNSLSYIPLNRNIYYPIPSRRDFGWGTYADITKEILDPIRQANPSVYGQGVIDAAKTVYDYFLVNRPEPIELNPDRDRGYSRGPLVLDMYKYKKGEYKAVQTNTAAQSNTTLQAAPQLKN